METVARGRISSTAFESSQADLASARCSAWVRADRLVGDTAAKNPKARVFYSPGKDRRWASLQGPEVAGVDFLSTHVENLLVLQDPGHSDSWVRFGLARNSCAVSSASFGSLATVRVL